MAIIGGGRLKGIVGCGLHMPCVRVYFSISSVMGGIWYTMWPGKGLFGCVMGWRSVINL